MEFEPSTWRLIIDESPRSGPTNMAIDQAIAEACASGDSIPTLRFYQWAPPAVSLGRHQRSTEIDFAKVEALGYEIVRRPTGGRAILHIDELTYSVTTPLDEPRIQGGIMTAYLHISNALVEGLRNLGVSADKADAQARAGKDASAACFEIPSAYEITAFGRKLMGSAQSRRAKYMLQHGSLPLRGDITRLLDVLILSPEEYDTLHGQLHDRACTLAQALQVDEGADNGVDMVGFAKVAHALCVGFEQILNLKLQPQPYSSDELKRSAQLIREQYANPEWTQYR